MITTSPRTRYGSFPVTDSSAVMIPRKMKRCHTTRRREQQYDTFTSARRFGPRVGKFGIIPIRYGQSVTGTSWYRGPPCRLFCFDLGAFSARAGQMKKLVTV